jgi:hypothetical protein
MKTETQKTNVETFKETAGTEADNFIWSAFDTNKPAEAIGTGATEKEALKNYHQDLKNY